MDVYSGRHRGVGIPRYHPLGAVIHVPTQFTHKTVSEHGFCLNERIIYKSKGRLDTSVTDEYSNKE